MNLEKICLEVCELTRTVGTYIQEEAQSFSTDHVKEKGLHDLVSYVDQQAEKQLISKLGLLLPEAGFIAEENQGLKQNELYNWIIDPLDGTTNFIHGIPVYSISIALMRNNILVLGVVHEVNRDECFYSWEHAPAFCNGEKIQVSTTEKLSNSLIATGFPYHDYDKLEAYMAVLQHLMRQTRGIRRLGSAAVDLAYVACGRFEGFYEYGLNPWDVAAGAFIVQQAGGQMSDFKGGADFVFGREIIASNGHTHDEFSKILNHYFK